MSRWSSGRRSSGSRAPPFPPLSCTGQRSSCRHWAWCRSRNLRGGGQAVRTGECVSGGCRARDAFASCGSCRPRARQVHTGGRGLELTAAAVARLEAEASTVDEARRCEAGGAGKREARAANTLHTLHTLHTMHTLHTNSSTSPPPYRPVTLTALSKAGLLRAGEVCIGRNVGALRGPVCGSGSRLRFSRSSVCEGGDLL